MSSTARLLVLGVVRIFQPIHGYDVRRELVSWRAEDWAPIKAGSIYNALNTLTSDGCLEVVGTAAVGGRPERTTYQLTAAGERELQTLLHEAWWTVVPPSDPLMAGLVFLGFIKRTEAIAALEARITQIRVHTKHLGVAIGGIDGVEAPKHVREMLRLSGARVRAEIEWSKALIKRLRAGDFTTADDPPWIPEPATTPRPRKRSPIRGRRP